MRIEKMDLADLEDVTSLADQLGYPSSTEEIRTRFMRIQRTQNYGLFVAKSNGGKVIGYVQINCEPETLLAGPRADVAALIVDANERGKGIGAALLRQAEHWAEQNKLPLIRIRSNIKRTDAHRFYQNKGYVINKSSHILTKSIA
ncbi:MAG: GNAT family N-acetyltransferase [Deltaproteobacteria bacterium]|nr:GNAT family N-acetyltransferase [Deltaproteobacteria bacterium]